MKLRIRGNSIRLRVSPEDLATLLGSGVVEEAVSFPAGRALRYRLESVADAPASAELTGTAIVVRFPADAVSRWSEPGEVAMRAEQALAGGQTLHLLVEKDFECLVPREGEDQDALFPNPRAAARGTI